MPRNFFCEILTARKALLCVPRMSCLEIPVVFPNRPAESMLQLFDALDNLDRVVEAVFGRITTRVRSSIFGYAFTY